MGEGRKKAKESRAVPHPKLNPGCATVLQSQFSLNFDETLRPSRPTQESFPKKTMGMPSSSA